MTRKEELLLRLAPIDRAEAVIKANLQPLQEGLTAIEEIRSTIIGDFDDIVIDRCEGCGVPLFVGEKGFTYADGEVRACRACAPTYADLSRDIAEHEAGKSDLPLFTPSSLEHFKERLRAHLDAGGALEDPCVEEM